MGPVYAEIDIDAPREVVFDYLMDFTTRPVLYGDSVEDFRPLRLDSRGVGAGARFRFRRRSAWADSAITAAERPARISERGVTGRYNRTGTGTEWELGESPTGLTRVRLSYWTSPPGLAASLDRLTGGSGWHTRRLKSAVTRLREEIESNRAATDPVAVAGGNRYATGIA